MLTQLTWKAHKCIGELQYFSQMLISRIESLLPDRFFFYTLCNRVPNGTAQPINGINGNAHGFSHITQSSFLMLLGNCSYDGSTITTILFVNILNDFFPPF